ncbi:putative bifunctional fatty acid transporter/acyl-CoA synthetase [Plectosphaerella plurivora]|uniref:Bifunctional fatty acid transporter/acyl-CoA synthetase n=1 Tax=Plectosphaerella plurivora TaxID=936078 RepID=A0A9P8V5L0_9PEZI|nr:putative bifunctional fatty acid transporter/acyl-CoA synthetase [Plectosphaerella plurivora]
MPPSLRVPTDKVAIAASAAAATLLGALYANNRYGVTYDINQLLSEKSFRKRFQDRIALLGDDVSLYHMWELADPRAEALWFENRRWTYGEVLEESSRLAVIFQRQGVSNGDVVAVFATNSPEMVFTIAAASKLGAIPALINTALQSHTLQHCLNIANAKILVCTPDLAPVIADLASIAQPPPTFTLSLLLRYEDLASITSDEVVRPKRLLKDVGALVYTSGTSGKPKAVAVKNFLLILVSTPATIDIKNPKTYLPLRTFSCLPLFHATALFTGIYYSTGVSGACCLSRKFSASRFSSQLAQSGATRMLYVGELCRYLTAAPESPYDRSHKCIVAMGNGLAKDIWLKFTKRFGIPEVREIYRSTEGLAKFDNYTRSTAAAGSVGFVGPIKLYAEDDTFLVRYDPTTESPYRDPKTGFCVRAKADEPGEAIGRVRSMDLLGNYHGDKAATDLKLISDVFQKGDLFQRTGDLLVRHSSGWVRFHDRSGDTFRWRGENVSASEVREHIEKIDGVQDCSVYAVKLEGYDGQAGAATITLNDPSQEPEFAKVLYAKLRASGLALYQMPRLIRFRPQIETTATFKKSTGALKKLPWDPSQNASDSIYWLNGDRFSKIDTSAWSQIEAGKAKL